MFPHWDVQRRMEARPIIRRYVFSSHLAGLSATWTLNLFRSDGTLRERCWYWWTDHAAIANHRRISARGTTPVRSAMMIPLRKSTKYGID